MPWQDAALTFVSLVFIAALIPSVVRRQTAPLSSCVMTAAGLLVIGLVDLTFHPVIVFTAATTLATSALWWVCAGIAWKQRPTAPTVDGDWMQTYTGRAFYPFDPRPADVDPADIAHALSLLCRYGGHVDRFYSVAEHCVLMSRAVAPEHALWALLHDATEAYVCDLPRPVKHGLPAYKALEDRVMTAICARFDLTGDCPAEVKAADNRILRDERAALLGASPLPWTSTEQVPRLGVQIHGWDPATAERQYLARLTELTAIPEGAAA